MYKPSPLFLEILRDAKAAGYQLSKEEKQFLKENNGETSDEEATP